MDERAIKRLLLIILVSIIAIMLFKVALTKTIVGLNKAAAEKKQAATARSPAPQQSPTPPATTAIIETPAASAVSGVTMVDSPVSSIEGETR